MAIRETLDAAGYRFRSWLGDGEVIFQCVATGRLEVWFANKNHASYGISWRGTDWEFARGYEGDWGLQYRSAQHGRTL